MASLVALLPTLISAAALLVAQPTSAQEIAADCRNIKGLFLSTGIESKGGSTYAVTLENFSQSSGVRPPSASFSFRLKEDLGGYEIRAYDEGGVEVYAVRPDLPFFCEGNVARTEASQDAAGDGCPRKIRLKRAFRLEPSGALEIETEINTHFSWMCMRGDEREHWTVTFPAKGAHAPP
jgi:hypothetical protein